MSLTVATGGGPRSGPMMAAARGIASDATVVISRETLDVLMRTSPAVDPLDDLIARVRPRASGAVDSLQVAAMLEADGITDRAARVEYGYADVFELADEVYRRVDRAARRPSPGLPTRATWPQAVRDVSHGALYLLPSALFPAVLAVVEPRSLLIALVLAGGLGWVWSGGTSWLAYQLLGRHDHRGAGRLLVRSGCAGVLVAAAVGCVLMLVTGGGFATAAVVPGVMAYQMASTVLMLYRQELWLASAMAPGVAAGAGYVQAGRALLGWALAAALVCVAVAVGIALRRALRGSPDQPSTLVGVRAVLRGRLRGFLLVVGYAALSAGYLLHAQAPYLLTRVDIVLAGVPLIVAMGVVEWRARRFAEQSRRLLRRVRYPREFVVRIWLLLAANLAACSLVVAAGALAMVGALRMAGWLSPAGVAMAAAQVALAGAYFLAFLLAGHDRYGWLCAALAVAFAVHLAVPPAVEATAPSSHSGALVDTSAFLGSAVLLEGLLLLALAPLLGQVWRYR